MLKYILSFFIVIHGLIHFIGFAKAFNFGTISQISKEISKPVGLLWLGTAFLFLFVTILFLLKKEAWMIVGITAIVISQLLIFAVWKDAKFGTIANIIILVAVLLNYGSFHFEKSYHKDVHVNLQRTNTLEMDLLTETDLTALPEPVKRYLKYAGVVNKPKVKNMRIAFEGQMREKGKDFFPFICEQYNFFDNPTRLFFMKAKIKGFTVPGYHKYSNANAIMDIRLFGLFSVVKKSGKEMDRAETVTLFNDMCLMAPATLIDKRISWQIINSSSAKAIFTNDKITISAILYFNEEGQLIDFISTDRDVNNNPFSTPVSNYKNLNGINIMTYGETIWHYPDGKFVYGKFNLKEVEYNVSGMK
ncbi:hypothetical protein SAMN05444372_11291 [Flavobacterium micromati]|uniref:Uncharacterized protein n=1 Tax=Flavobacterium micromati TaxID=229205 RepID=A0A1M5P7F5_9FLAO|nr:DUF6544 family protein [Flavobacterium micromati]MCL6461676.1 hypothetical protein [Flavobacterium micromati]SHG97716.1 hypothetical protein SAMN05444372_11291 [Flavobacterium micromati]